MNKLFLKFSATTIILVLFLAPGLSRSSASPGVFENGEPSIPELYTEVLYAISSPTVPNLLTIDPVTGAILSSTPITNAEALFGGLSYDGTQLFSIDGYNDPISDRTFRIDPLSGEGTIVGDTGFNWNFRSVELHPQTGVLYATRDSELYTINKITGIATAVATISGPTLNQVTALAIDNDGKAYVTDTMGTGLFQLNLATGEVTHLGDLNLCNWWIADLAFNHSDQLWAVCAEEGGLYVIDIGNVTATFQFVSGGFSGLAFSGLVYTNGPPTISGAQSGQTVDDNASIDPFTGVTISDPDDDTLNVIVSLDNAAKGDLTTLGGFVEGPSGIYTFVGRPASATTAIRGLTFNPTENRKTPGNTDTTTFTISADDDIADPVTDDTTTVIATSINDSPTISGTVADQTLNDNATIDPFTGVTISDPDKNASLTMIVSLDDPDKGDLTNLGGFVEGPPGTYTYDCSPSEATTAIQGLTFDPTPGRVPVGQTETTTFTITADDSFADPVTDDTTTVIVTAVGAPNTPPSISGTQAGQTVDDNATIDPFSAVTIADPDTVAITVTVTLDDPAKGILINLGGFVEGPTGTYTFVGSPAESITIIQGLTFDPTEGRVAVGDTETTTFTISADDSIADPVTDNTTTVIVTVVEKTKILFLPLVDRNICSNFFDDFSDPASGWDVVDDDFEYTEYLNGEYRVVPLDTDYFYYYPAPTCSRHDYVVEVDARWASTPGGSYAILFGALGDYSRFYTYEIDTVWQEFSVWRVDPSGWTVIVPWTHSSAINAGTSSNHLKLTRDGIQITLEVNGIVLGTRSDNSLTCLTYVGVMTAPYYEQPTYDVRFDNFSLKGNK